MVYPHPFRSNDEDQEPRPGDPDRAGQPAGSAQQYMGFVGVTTEESSIMRVFPRWADALALPARTLRGHDVPLHAPPACYREVVRAIRDDPRHHGALVTSHKLSLFNAAHDLFDVIGPHAELFGEVSSIAKHDGRLTARALDPLTVRLALEEFVLDRHFEKTGGSALVLGAGGAGCALAHCLATRTDLPSTLVCTDVSAARLEHLRSILEQAGLDSDRFRTVQIEGVSDTDALLEALPPGSLVANATGMGKDVPGSPVSTASFPDHGLIWELNYRGPRAFLLQARMQQQERGLTVVDGWRYFIHGWTQVIAEVFAIPMPTQTVDALADLAKDLR